MVDVRRLFRRDLCVAFAVVLLVGALSAALEAQKRVGPAGTYAIEVGGSPGVLSLRYNATARQPAQPQAPTGLVDQTGLLLAANNCVGQDHAVSPGHGLWQIVPRTNGRSVAGATVHAFSSVPGGTTFTFQKIIWSIKIEIGAAGLVGGARVEYYDSLENLRTGIPACTSRDLELRGWATFPSS